LRRSVLALFAAIVVASGVIAVGVAEAEAETDSYWYWQIVDNSSEDRFKADEEWGTSSYGRGVTDDNYRFARPAEGAEPAQFKFEIPETANYAVYASWPQVKGGNDSVPVGVVTTSGTEWTLVNQQRDGGRWVRLGVYEMQAGDDYSVLFSRETTGRDYVIADAVKVEYDSDIAPPSEPAKSEEASKDSESDKASKDSEMSDQAGRPGQDVVTEARKWTNVPYRLGGISRRGIDCSGLTMMVYKKAGISLPHSDDQQYRHGRKVSGSPEPGDLVFFNEHGRGISHVGIYTGNGKLIHASDYFNKVTESEMKYIRGYVGARKML
jgi:cell wall-associated NlpC family hydrolase